MENGKELSKNIHTLETETQIEFQPEHNLLREGIDEELRLIKQKEGEGKTENRGRIAFMLARSSELGFRVEVDDELWQAMVDKGLNPKIKENDPWGITFMAGYLKEIDPERFRQLKDSFTEATDIIADELMARKERALRDPKKWKEYLAMAEHLVNLESEIMDSKDFEMDDLTKDGIRDYLEKVKEKAPLDYLEVLFAIEKLSDGIVEELGIDRDEIRATLKAAQKVTNEYREKRDYFYFTAGKRLIGRIKRKLSI